MVIAKGTLKRLVKGTPGQSPLSKGNLAQFGYPALGTLPSLANLL